LQWFLFFSCILFGIYGRKGTGGYLKANLCNQGQVLGLIKEEIDLRRFACGKPELS
ncbi:hypothetical protein BAE44_0012535, partial [Dichanthelium oligosanthes]